MTDRSAVSYWNRVARSSDRITRGAILEGYEGTRDFDASGKEDAEYLVLPFVSSDCAVLDFGCGIGRMLKWVAPRCKRAAGVDVSSQMLKRARRYLRHYDNVELELLDACSLSTPWASGEFDFVYFYHVAEHLEREDAYRILTEIRRCLRRGGKCLVQFSLLSHPDNKQEFLKWSRLADNDSARSRFYTEEEVHLLLEMAGFHPLLRVYVPGEMVLVASSVSSSTIGQPAASRLFLRPSRSSSC